MSETTREEALRRLRNEAKRSAPDVFYPARVLGHHLDTILAMPALRWVSVEERLPTPKDGDEAEGPHDDDGYVLWLYADGSMGCAPWDMAAISDPDQYTHWLPLSAIPRPCNECNDTLDTQDRQAGKMGQPQ